MKSRPEKGRLEIFQKNCIENVLENFGMKEAKRRLTPVAENNKSIDQTVLTKPAKNKNI